MRISKDTTLAWKNIFKPTPKRVSQFLFGIKGSLAAVAVSSYIMDNAKLSFWILLSGAVIDQVAQFIGNAEEDIETKE